MIYQKQYNSYDEYVYTQGIKANEHTDYVLSAKKKRIRSFKKEFKKYLKYMNRGSVLCLGARDGAEKNVFETFGFENCVGIDLHPMSEEVIKGDWHRFPFGDCFFDNIYTNSFDHCFNIDDAVNEIIRVLKHKGVFIFSTDKNYSFNERKDKTVSIDKYIKTHKYNALFWDSINDIKNKISASGLVFLHNIVFGSKITLFFKKAYS